MKGTSLTVMAWRNLWRNRRRTLLTLSSIAFGVFLAVIATAMQDRNWSDMIDLAARLGAGHVTVEHPEYLDTPTLTRTVAETEALREAVAGESGVRRVVERISGHVMLATASESFGAAFLAIDPEQEDRTTLSLVEAIAEGGLFTSATDGGILLGRGLAGTLGVELGERVVYTMTDRHGEIVSGLARLGGIIETGSPSVDRGLALLPLDAVRRVLDYDSDETTQLAIFLEDQRQTDRVAARLAALLDSRVAVVPWHESQPELAGFIAMKVGGAIIMELVIALLVAAGIFNTLFVSVMERLREFGIMMAIGFSPGRLFRLVMLESFWLGLVGLLAAALVTIGPYSYLSTTGLDMSAMLSEETSEISGIAMPTVMKVGIFPENVAIIAVAALVATLLSGLYPAWKAGHVQPVESIKLV